MNRLIVAVMLIFVASSAQAQAPCSNLTGSARTSCLNAAQLAQQQAAQRAAQQQAAQLAQQQAAQRAAQQQAAQLAQQQAAQRAAQQAAQQQTAQQAQQRTQQQAAQQVLTTGTAKKIVIPAQNAANQNASASPTIHPTVAAVPATSPTTPSFNTSQTTPMTNQRTAPVPGITAPSSRPAPSNVAFMSPNLGITPHNANNCVYFLSRDLHISLPGNLYTYQQKQNIANVQGDPRVGDVAIIRVNSGPNMPFGHVALVTGVTPTSITIVEANFKAGIVDSRVSTASNLQGAEQQLNITGFYR